MQKYKADWEKLLTAERLYVNEDGECEAKSDQKEQSRTAFSRDCDRIIFSSAFRRLSKKTQVHPLAVNDHVHNRLTHSLEVSSVGRSVGTLVGVFLEEKKILPEGIYANNIGEIVQAACLAHDIGNPPFGHAGESALQNWFVNPDHSKYIEHLTPVQKSDFNNFDGNAQSFRIVTTLEYNVCRGGMRLTYPTLASMVKYPISSHRSEEKGKPKFGFYESEKKIFMHMASRLGLGETFNEIRRHPLSFLTEAADDICYNLIDLEDACEMKILTVDDFCTAVAPLLDETPQNMGIKSNQSARRQVSALRSQAIGVLIGDTVSAFTDNLDQIMSGDFSGNLIDLTSERTRKSIEAAKQLSRQKVFKEIRKVTLEIGAYTVFEKLFDTLIPAVYERVYKKNESFKTTRVIDLLGVNAPSKDADLYSAYQAVIDFVSGMTDDYATVISSQFSGAGQ